MCSRTSRSSSHTQPKRVFFAILAILSFAPCAMAAEKAGGEKSPEAAIRATADAFVKAFNRGDAKAVAALWTANGSLADERGEIFKGRKAIEDQYAAFFKAYPGAKMEVTIKSIEFPTETTAIEDGTAQVTSERAGPPAVGRYTAVHVREDGKWLMASVRESSLALPSNFSQLQDLGWMIGDWEAKRNGTTVQTSLRWIANKSFIQRDYTVREEGVVSSSGTQIIGWDPRAGQVRSWSFDSAGGYGTGLWSPAPEGWRIESTGMLPDGTATSSQDLLIRVAGEDNVLGWRSFDRRAGDATLPDTREVVLDRVLKKK